MSFLDKLKDKLTPDPSNVLISTSASGGIGSRRGALGFEDDMIVSKPAIICHTSQAFFNFIAMCCFASVASFQAHFHIGPSGLSGFALFVSIAGMFLSLFLLLVPLANEKFNKLTRVARALKEDRATFVLVGAGTGFSFLIAFITTISAWTQAGCKNAKNDPHAKELGDSFTNGLGGWCATKKAGAIFFWFAFGFWAGSLTLAILEWRKNRASRPRDPPFEHPTDVEEGDDESAYDVVPSLKQLADDDTNSPFSDTYRYSGASSTVVGSSAGFGSPGKYNIPSAPQPRPSLDAYGAFSDPAPTGFGAPPSDGGVTGMSRTMQYADPYAAVRASIASEQISSPPSYR
ncbi:hypothetical protein B0F90DRAFT_1740615 [Multifurca ochricompacta]|uniref:MARVEL domain-containing protein n=1 Tax=Multifurca ochricompacta TaxID=376703 RepID=A0AAD4M0B0_9AGAM|nr:hypothetical protein B0F90DRAFT_1740615 [Multifurca ochricompacta]